MSLDLISRLVDPIVRILEKRVPDADLRAQLEADLKLTLIRQESELVQASKEVVLAEANGTWMQRNWRPSLMFVFIAILANNYVFTPWLGALGFDRAIMLEFPQEFWGLMTVGVGGYVAGRTIEKTASGVRINMGQNQDGS